MTDSKHLLFELGCEELPPKSLEKLSQALLDLIKAGINQAELSFTGSHCYATPRRLAVIIENLASSQADKTMEKRGPAVKAAFADDGTPSKAAQGFAKSCGTTVDQLNRLTTDKGEWLAFSQEVKGQSAKTLIPDIIHNSIHHLPIAKRMRWGSYAAEFVRPVHWAVLLYGRELIATEILGVNTGTETQGHRFHAPEAITLASADDYQDKLYEQGKVIADIGLRKAVIRNAAQRAAEKLQGIAHIEEELLEEIAALNEWPVPVTGNFDQRFLALPAEVLITTMQVNQKYFPVKNANGDLLPHFITFSNIESSHPESIQHGNERVITPRLADAEFFWNQDTKRHLEDRIDSLSSIIFQKNLGTIADKTNRVVQLAEFIAGHLHADSEPVKRAALLAKTDLMTDMVGEFASLQGIMGRYYALVDGEAVEVAQAIEEQYYPKQSGSPTPGSSTGQILSIAEKVDTLCGIFSTGLVPTGDKDPYALRRAALGILRIIIENKLDLDIIECVDFSLARFSHEFALAETHQAIIDFIFDRLKGYCLDQGHTADEFEAVLSVLPGEPLDFTQRLQAVSEFRQRPEAESLSAANKRIRNILKKSETPPSAAIENLVEAQERTLMQAAEHASADITPLLEQRDYQAALNRLAQLKDDVDAFFDHIMVMTDDLQLRANRLGLLAKLEALFLQIADISKLQS